MAIKTDAKIQVNFSEETAYGEYADALYYTEEEYKKVTPAELKIAMRDRVDKWLLKRIHPEKV